MSDVLFVVAPFWSQAPASVHRDPDEAILAATRLSEGCRVLVIDPDTAEWEETQASQLFHPDDRHHVRGRLASGLREIGDRLVNKG